MIRILLTLLTPTLVSCGIIQKMGHEKPQPQEVQKIPARQIVGRIASVSETGKFVLIQKYGPGKLPKNSLFQTHGVDGTSASLKPSGERVRDFFAADIISGKAKQGDAVSSFRLLPEKPAETPVSEAQSPSFDEEEPE